MIRKLIKRPVAVSMVLFAVAVLGAVSIKLIPVSLMPDVDIPQITVQVKVDGSSAREMDQYLQGLRRELMQKTQGHKVQCDGHPRLLHQHDRRGLIPHHGAQPPGLQRHLQAHRADT